MCHLRILWRQVAKLHQLPLLGYSVGRHEPNYTKSESVQKNKRLWRSLHLVWLFGAMRSVLDIAALKEGDRWLADLKELIHSELYIAEWQLSLEYTLEK